MTSGASNFEWATATTIEGATASGVEKCSLAGTTAATCTKTLGVANSATHTSTTVVATLSGSNYYRYNVEITGGAEMTANPTATCSAKGAATNRNSKNAVMWALAGVVVVAMQTIL